MWDRGWLKTLAKQELKVSYWVSLAVTFVAGILGGLSSGGGIRINFGGSGPYFRFSFGDFSSPFAGFLAGITLFILLLTLCFSIFVGSPIEVGMRAFFARAPYGERNFITLFWAFRKEHYLNIVKVTFIRNLFTFLWSLLFVIPGIIKSYEYRMVSYILSDSPDIPYKQALEISKQMTYGHKADMFILDLSFIGWTLLGSLACGIGVIFLQPYIAATNAQLYLVFKQNYFSTSNQQNQQIPYNM